jgi:3-hydroxyisobutyrate dehydrogenase
VPVKEGRGKQFPSRIGFIGMGNIGTFMVSNLVRAGFDVTVYDLRAEALAAAAELGAKTATSLREVAQTCDIVEVTVVNSLQVRNVTMEAGGLLEHLGPGAVIIIHSTVPPQTVQEVATAAEKCRVSVLDAPVSGADIAAKAGTLTILLGGDKAVIERCSPLLETLGANIFHLGPVGLGQVGKLANALMAHVNYLAALEAVRLAKGYGVPEEKILELAKVSTGNSWMIEHWDWRDRILTEHTMAGTEQFIHYLMRKDLIDAVEAANAVKVYLPLAGLAMQVAPGMIAERKSSH